MHPSNRAPTVIAICLIAVGVLFLAFNFLNVDFGRVWPVIFFVIGGAFYLPIWLMPEARAALSALLIPGTILIGLGLIFFYNTLTNDWESWAYIWALIPAFVGLGLMLAARAGGWIGNISQVGLWIALISGGVFSVLAMFFGSRSFGLIGSLVLIGFGVVLLFRSTRGPART
jgi:hypothetical protein